MNTRISFILAAIALVAVALSCTEDPTRIGRPPVVQGFSPTDQVLSVFTGDTLVFTVRAIDPDKSTIRQSFTIGDSVVSGGNQWEYVVDDTGMVIVRCVVSDGEYESRIQWSVDRHERINHPPVIKTFSPVEPNPTMIIGTTLEFVVDAVDPDDDPVETYFTIDDERVSDGDRFQYTTDEEGSHVVQAVASDGELFARHTWDLTVTGIPDTIPPAAVTITRLDTGVEPGEVIVEWTAVGQDGLEGDASNYLVRTSPETVLTEEDWDRGSEQPNVPEAVPSGQTMSMTITGMIPARFTHVTVRAVDDFGNLSPIGASPGVYTRGMKMGGRVYDAITLETIPDVTVHLAHFTTRTDINGEFEFIELPPLDNAISLLDETEAGVVGDYYNLSTPYVVKHNDFLSLYLLPAVPLDTPYYVDFLQFFRAMTDTEGIPPGTQQRRWEPPIDVYVPPFTANGLDFAATVASVAHEFDDIVGTPLFHVVTEEPAVGVNILYIPTTTADNFQVTQWDKQYYPVKARIKFRTLYSPASVGAFKVIIRHEFGHALGLNHSEDHNHIMVGGQTPGTSVFTADEINLIRARYNIPRGRDMRNYSRE